MKEMFVLQETHGTGKSNTLNCLYEILERLYLDADKKIFYDGSSKTVSI